MKKGIDVSEMNGNINWDSVKSFGIDFAYVRAGYGKNNIDKTAAFNIKSCNDRNIPVGVYWFGYPLNAGMATNEAKYCIDFIKNYKIDLPIAYDLEGDSIKYASRNGVNTDKDWCSSCAESFLAAIRAGGYKTTNYTNYSMSKNSFKDDIFETYTKWLAYYNSTLDGETCSIWQYTSSGKVDGISGNVDMNFLVDESLLSSEQPATAVTTAAISESTSTIATKEKTQSTGDGFDMSQLPTLTKGSKGRSVEALQTILTGYGFNCNGVDGIFGDNTLSALKSYQSYHGLEADGYCGPLTWSSILL
jgi:lysozyme